MNTHFQPQCILVDGSSYLFRAYHALPPLTNSQGQPTGAIYGVITMLRKLIATYQPAYLAMVFDTKAKTFRSELFDAYKAHRIEMPEELAVQITPLFDVIRAMGIPLLTLEGYEADDIIGTLAHRASKLGLNTLISTGDKDMTQLVNDQICLINTMSQTFFDRAAVEEKFGVPPELIIDYLTLVGDSVDNVPGVPGVGPKTAVKWLKEYGDLNQVVAHADTITGKVGENLRQTLPQLELSKTLVTIHLDVPLNVQPTDLIMQPAQTEALIALFKILEFKSWMKELLEDKPLMNSAVNALSDSQHYHIINTLSDLENLISKLHQAKYFVVDTETTSLQVLDASLVGISCAVTPHEAYYVPFGHQDTTITQLTRAQVLEEFKSLLENPKLLKIGHHLKYDINVLANEGIQLQGIAFDTLLESYVLNSTAGRHDMDSLALTHLGYRTITFEDVAGKGSKQITFDQVPITTAARYAAEDADITLQLHEELYPQLAAIPGLKTTFHEIEMPLVPVLARMEYTGVLIDADLLQQQSTELATRLQSLEEETYALAEEMFNLNSPKQLQTILYDKLGMPILERTPTGQPSTSESTLQALAHDYALPKLILEYRTLSKLKSTYTDRLPEQIHPKTGRVHTSYNQAVAATGRLSSTDPNLQNIPARTLEGLRIREAFIAAPGYRILSADYSQIELRIMAHLSNDAGLLNAFAQGLDIHRATAAEIFGVPLEQVTALQRRSAKAINFGLIYGMSAFGLARQIEVDRNAAQQYIDVYFRRYPGVKAYMENTRVVARSQGFVETLQGRRLYLPDINARNMQRQKAAERTAINAPMQGTAADIIKKAMIEVDAWLQHSEVDARMIMQVHDELIFEVRENAIDTFVPQIKAYMENAMTLKVPLIVDIGIGKNWREAHD